MAKRPVKMQTSIAGSDFSLMPGETVLVPVAVAEAWIAAGIATEPPAEAGLELALGETRAEISRLQAELADVVADRDAVKAQAEQLGAQVAELEAKAAAASKPAKAAKPAA